MHEERIFQSISLFSSSKNERGELNFFFNLKYRPQVIIWCLGLGVNSCALWLRQTKDRLFFNVHCVLSGLACIVLVTVKMISVGVINKDLGFLLHNQLLFSKFFIRKYQLFKTKIKLWHIWRMSWNSTVYLTAETERVNPTAGCVLVLLQTYRDILPSSGK